MGQLPDLVIDQGDVRGVHGDVAPDAAHGDADGRAAQGGASFTPSPIMQTGAPASSM